MTRGNQVLPFSVASDRRAVVLQPCTNFDRASSDLTRISISKTQESASRTFLVCLVLVSTTQFYWFPLALMACVDDGSNVPTSLLPATSSNSGSLNGSAALSTGWAIAHTMNRSKRSKICVYHSCGDSQISKIASRPSVTPWVSSLPGLPMLNRSSIPPLPRWFHLQLCSRRSTPSHRMLAPSLHACARSKQVQPLLQAFSRLSKILALPGQVDGPTAAGFHGPRSPDDSRNTRRRPALFSTTSLLLGGTLQFFLGEAIFFSTSLLKSF